MSEDVTPIKPPMTQEECENWIMVKGQSGERWFEVRILDEEVGQDPNMISLMEIVSDMIFQGIKGMPFTEAEHQRTKVARGVDLAIVGQNGKPVDDTT